MSSPEKGYNINQTFIIDTTEGDSVLSACTALFTANIYSCSGNTEILLGNSSVDIVGDLFVNGDLSATTISATTYYGDGSNLTGISTQDTFVTGGTYTNGTAVFTNNTGGTFSISGFSTGYTLTSSEIINTLGYVPLSSYTDTFVTGGTYTNGTVVFTNNTGGTFSVTGFYTGATDVFVTGGTYSNGTAEFKNNTGGTFNVSGFTTPFSGGTVSGETLFITGITAATVSASTFYGDGSNLTGISTQDTFVTGATYSNNTFTFRNNTGGTFTTSFNSVTGLTVNGILSATTISATTFFGNGSNLTGVAKQDTFVTGATYSNNTFTFRNNTGGTFTTSFNSVTGLTVNGNITITGTSNLNGQIVSTNLSGTTNRLVQVNSGGTISATNEIISAYISSGSTAATLLDNNSNWDINGIYTGTTITGTYQGQKHYNSNYFYEAIQDNVFIRLIRG
jgi:fibronectin-binding autotransporter adhesin